MDRGNCEKAKDIIAVSNYLIKRADIRVKGIRLSKTPIIWRIKINLFDKNFSFFILKFSFMCSYIYIYVERKMPIIVITITLQNKPPNNIQP